MDPKKVLIAQLSLPKDGEILPNSYSWSKRGGFAGDKAVDRVLTAAKRLGWEQTDRNGATSKYTSPEGDVLTLHRHFGQTKNDNFFGISVNLASTAEAVKMNQLQLRKLIESVVSVKTKKRINEDAVADMGPDEMASFDLYAEALAYVLTSELEGDDALVSSAFEFFMMKIFMGNHQNGEEPWVPVRIEDIESIATELVNVVINEPSFQEAVQKALASMLRSAMQG